MAVGCGETTLGSGVPKRGAVGNGPGPPGVAVSTGVSVGKGVSVAVGGPSVDVAVAVNVFVGVRGTALAASVALGGTGVVAEVGSPVEVGIGVDVWLRVGTERVAVAPDTDWRDPSSAEQATAAMLQSIKTVKKAQNLTFNVCDLNLSSRDIRATKATGRLADSSSS